jgi:inorganic pyrophosphatase
MVFTFYFGFIPSTLAEDGDPLDVMVLMDEPAHAGCLLDVRIIGVIEAEQTQAGKAEVNVKSAMRRVYLTEIARYNLLSGANRPEGR